MPTQWRTGSAQGDGAHGVWARLEAPTPEFAACQEAAASQHTRRPAIYRAVPMARHLLYPIVSSSLVLAEVNVIVLLPH